MNIIALCNRILPYVCNCLIGVALAVWLIRLVEMIASSVRIRREATSLRSVDYRRFQESEHIMPVSLILPTIAEKENLTACVDNLLSLEFKRYEVIVVADSANEESWQGLFNGYRLLPFSQPYKKSVKSGHIAAVYRSAADARLTVLDQRGGSRADALNAGVNVSSYPVVAVTYPQLRLTKNALLKTMYSFVGDPACVCIGTFPRVGAVEEQHAGQKLPLLAEEQGVERLRMLYANRPGYAGFGLYPSLQATFAAFLKSAVIEAGGFSGDTDAEQTDLLLRILARMRAEKRKHSTRLLPDATCYQMPLAGMRAVRKNMSRADAAMRNAIKKNAPAARMIPAFRAARMQQKGLPLMGIAALLLLLGSAAIGMVSVWLAVFYLLLSALFGALQSTAAVLLEENAYRLQTDTGMLKRRYFAAVLVNFGYRQATALARILTPKK